MKKIILFAGTRPEIIKLAPVYRTLKHYKNTYNVKLIITGQHKEMLYQTLNDFDLVPDIALDVMRERQTLAQLSSELFSKIDIILESENPDLVIIQGDTTTVLIAALCSFYRNIHCAHIEAGLRSNNLHSPFPEELNRRVVSIISSLHFSPTETSAKILKDEGINPKSIFITGNTVIDSLLWIVDSNIRNPPIISKKISYILESYSYIILITGHRRENFGTGLQNICNAINILAQKFPKIAFLWPLHLNPYVQEGVKSILDKRKNIVISPPLPYREFVHIMKNSYCILSDSGGIQEEAPALNKPILITRNTTERPEGIKNGCACLVGTDSNSIISAVSKLIEDPTIYNQMARSLNPYGDGTASEKIVNAIIDWFSNRELICD